jgi:hypothetical protein
MADADRTLMARIAVVTALAEAGHGPRDGTE